MIRLRPQPSLEFRYPFGMTQLKHTLIEYDKRAQKTNKQVKMVVEWDGGKGKQKISTAKMRMLKYSGVKCVSFA